MPPTLGAIVVSCGDMLSRFTTGVYTSVKHRVAAPSVGVHRYSVPLFGGGNPDYLLDVLPMGKGWEEWVCGNKGQMPVVEKKWEPITAGQYFEMKWRESEINLAS